MGKRITQLSEMVVGQAYLVTGKGHYFAEQDDNTLSDERPFRMTYAGQTHETMQSAILGIPEYALEVQEQDGAEAFLAYNDQNNHLWFNQDFLDSESLIIETIDDQRSAAA
jgi:hypothetical protein